MSIIVSDVSYRYSNQQSLFKHISFSVSSGRKVSVISNKETRLVISHDQNFVDKIGTTKNIELSIVK